MTATFEQLGHFFRVIPVALGDISGGSSIELHSIGCWQYGQGSIYLLLRVTGFVLWVLLYILAAFFLAALSDRPSFLNLSLIASYCFGIFILYNVNNGARARLVFNDALFALWLIRLDIAVHQRHFLNAVDRDFNVNSLWSRKRMGCGEKNNFNYQRSRNAPLTARRIISSSNRFPCFM